MYLSKSTIPTDIDIPIPDDYNNLDIYLILDAFYELERGVFPNITVIKQTGEVYDGDEPIPYYQVEPLVK